MELSDSAQANLCQATVGAYTGAPLSRVERPAAAISPAFVQVWLDVLRQQRAIAVIRASTLSVGHHMADAVVSGGMQVVEVTWNSDRPADLVRRLRAEYPDCWIGAGTVLTHNDLHEAIQAGAQFIFSPHTNLALIQAALQHQIPVIPGALSPTEIVAAWQAGATCVKVFPAHLLGGAAYLNSLQGPLGHIPLIPTGGVTLDNAAAYLQAGAIALGLAGELFPKAAIAAGDWSQITAQAKRLMQHLQPHQNL